MRRALSILAFLMMASQLYAEPRGVFRKTNSSGRPYVMIAVPGGAAPLPYVPNTYYVATAGGGGSNSNSGTIGSPFLTTQYAYTVAAACGDTIYIRGGTYDGRLIDGRIVYADQTKTGTPALDTIHHAATTVCGSYANGITIRNYPGEDVHLTATSLGRINDQMFHIDSQALDDDATPGVHVHDDYYLTLTGEPGHPIDFDGSSMPPGCFVTYDAPEAGNCPTMGETPSGDWAGSACWGGIHSDRIRWWNVKCHDTSGVAITPDSSYIEFDYLEQYGVLHTQGLYLSNGHNYIIDHSYIHNDRCYGAQIYEGTANANVSDNIVRNSRFSQNNKNVDGSTSGCGGGLNISSGSRDLVYNNIFDNNGGYGLSIFTSMYDCQILNNTFTKNVWGIRSSGVRCSLKNNIIQGQTANADAEGGTSGIDIDDVNGSATAISNNITAPVDPKFVNSASNDYTLQGTSPAIGYGLNLTSLGIFTTDYLGNTRSASAAWTAGAYDNGAAPTPSLVSVSPISLAQGATSQTITFTAANITLDGTSVPTTNCSGVTNNSHALVDALHITLNVTVAGGAAIATCSPSITTTGSPTISLTNGFSVTASATPTITIVTPSAAVQGQSNLDVAVTATSSNFSNGVTGCVLSTATGITVVSTTVTNATHLTVRFSFDLSTATGVRNLTCTTNAEVIVATNAFTVNAASGCTLPNLVTGQCGHQPNDGTPVMTIVSPSLPVNVDPTGGTHYVGAGLLIDKNGSTASNPVTSITSACGFTYSKYAAGATNLIVQLEIWLAKVTSICSEHYTANYGSNHDYGVGFIREFHDLAASSPKDAEATATGSSATPSVAVTASVANDLIWTIILSSSAAISATSPATGIELLDNYADEMVVPASSGSKTQAFATANQFYDILTLALKPNVSTPASITTVSPSSCAQITADCTLTLTGLNSNWTSNSVPSLSDMGGIGTISFTRNSATSATWHFSVSAGASLIATRNVCVTEGSEQACKSAGFSVTYTQQKRFTPFRWRF